MLADPTPEAIANASIEKPEACIIGAIMLKNNVPNRVPIIYKERTPRPSSESSVYFSDM